MTAPRHRPLLEPRAARPAAVIAARSSLVLVKCSVRSGGTTKSSSSRVALTSLRTGCGRSGIQYREKWLRCAAGRCGRAGGPSSYAKAARTQRRWQEGGVLCLESLCVAEGGHECGGGLTDRRRLQRRERHPSHPALGRRAVDVQHRSGLADVSGAAGQQRTSPQFRAVSARRQPQLELWCGATPLGEGGQIARAALSRLEPPAGACSADLGSISGRSRFDLGSISGRSRVMHVVFASCDVARLESVSGRSVSGRSRVDLCLVSVSGRSRIGL